MPSHSFGGLLLGLGLQGTLARLSNRMVVDLLTPHHDGVAIGLLLGLAAAKMGTEDYQVSKTLRLYLNAAMPASYADHDFPTMVQVRCSAMHTVLALPLRCVMHRYSASSLAIFPGGCACGVQK